MSEASGLLVQILETQEETMADLAALEKDLAGVVVTVLALRAENERLREALQKIANDPNSPDGKNGGDPDYYAELAMFTARAALGGK